MKTNANNYHGYRLPHEIISHGVWQNHRFSLSFCDVGELLARRGIVVTYETIRQWCRKFGPEYARRLKRRQEAKPWRLVTDKLRSYSAAHPEVLQQQTSGASIKAKRSESRFLGAHTIGTREEPSIGARLRGATTYATSPHLLR